MTVTNHHHQRPPLATTNYWWLASQPDRHCESVCAQVILDIPSSCLPLHLLILFRHFIVISFRLGDCARCSFFVILYTHSLARRWLMTPSHTHTYFHYYWWSFLLFYHTPKNKCRRVVYVKLIEYSAGDDWHGCGLYWCSSSQGISFVHQQLRSERLSGNISSYF